MIGLLVETVGMVAQVVAGTLRLGFKATKLAYKGSKAMYKGGKFTLKAGFKATKKGVSMGKGVYNKIQQTRQFTMQRLKSPQMHSPNMSKSNIFNVGPKETHAGFSHKGHANSKVKGAASKLKESHLFTNNKNKKK